MKKKLLILPVVLLVLTNGFWLYAAIDLMVTEKYRQQVEYERIHSIDALNKLLTDYVHGIPKDELRARLERVFPDDMIFEKDGSLIGPWISFEITNEDKIAGATRQ